MTCSFWRFIPWSHVPVSWAEHHGGEIEWQMLSFPYWYDGKWETRQELRLAISFNALLNCDLLPSAVSSLKSSHLSHVGQPFKCSILQGTHCIRAITPRHPVANHFVPSSPSLDLHTPLSMCGFFSRKDAKRATLRAHLTPYISLQAHL